jgi:tRNA A-37 threonylcarbamoyl transferase component Bud32
MDRPRRVPFEYEYKNNREREKEREKEESIDPFGTTNQDFLNPNEEENNSKPSGGTLSWLDDVDNLHLPSRKFNNNENNGKVDLNQNEKNDFHNNFKIHDRNDNLREKGLQEELEIEKIKVKRLESELNRLKNIKETKNSKNILEFINKISYSSLGLGKKIGQGGFSEIYESQWLGIPVAVKVIFDPNITEALMEEFNNEIEKLFILRHPYIVQLYGITDREKSQKLAVITELAPKGSLFDYLHKNPKTKNNLSLDFKNKITKQLICTMAYIHSRGYVHRDLKTQNILLDKNLDMKMCDFGLTKLKSELNSGSGQFAGTPCYMAPELFDRKFYDDKVDVFAFGTVIWEIYTQKIPYANCDAMEIKQKVTKGEELYCSSIVPKQIANLIQKCRAVKASDRPTFEQIEKMNIL